MLNKKCLTLFMVLFATIALLGISQVQAQSVCQDAVLMGDGKMLLKFDSSQPNCKFVAAYACTTPYDLSTCTIEVPAHPSYCCDGVPGASGTNCSPCNFSSRDTGCYFKNVVYYGNANTAYALPCYTYPYCLLYPNCFGPLKVPCVP